MFSELTTGGPALDFGIREDLSEEVIFKLRFKSANRASLVAQLIKNSPSMRETWVHSLGWEDPLEKGTATHSGILVFWHGEFHGLCSPWGCKESDTAK